MFSVAERRSRNVLGLAMNQLSLPIPLPNTEEWTTYPACKTLRQLRRQRGWTMFQVATTAVIMEMRRHGEIPESQDDIIERMGRGVDNIFICKFESGEDIPWPTARRKLAAVFGMTEEELFPELLRKDGTFIS